MVVLPGALPEKFFFTVWDDGVAASINRNVGRRVTLHYEEKVGLPTSCFGETRYFIKSDATAGVIPASAGCHAPATSRSLPVCRFWRQWIVDGDPNAIPVCQATSCSSASCRSMPGRTGWKRAQERGAVGIKPNVAINGIPAA